MFWLCDLEAAYGRGHKLSIGTDRCGALLPASNPHQRGSLPEFAKNAIFDPVLHIPALAEHVRPANQEIAEAIAEMNSLRLALNRHAIVAQTDRVGRITHVNDLFCAISGYTHAELIGARHSVVNSGHHPTAFFQEMWKTISSGKGWHGEICNRKKDGTLYWVDTTIVPKLDSAGKVTGYCSIRYDITQRKSAEQALVEENVRRQRAEHLLRDVLETLPSAVTACDQDDRLVLFNSAFLDCYPSIAGEVRLGESLNDILHRAVEDRGSVQKAVVEGNGEVTAARKKARRNPDKPFLQHLHGDRWLKVHERRSPAGFKVGVRTDVTELKRAEGRIKIQAETDPLTGLSNRRVLMDRLKSARGGLPTIRSPMRRAAARP